MKYSFASPDEWRFEAMQRISDIDAAESEKRRSLADAHNREHGIADTDMLADQELFILGKMDIEEYQEYLLFKYSKET